MKLKIDWINLRSLLVPGLWFLILFGMAELVSCYAISKGEEAAYRTLKGAFVLGLTGGFLIFFCAFYLPLLRSVARAERDWNDLMIKSQALNELLLAEIETLRKNRNRRIEGDEWKEG